MIAFPQDVPPPVPVAPTSELVQQLQTLTWVDHTALGVLLVFFVLGLFKGLIWQVSRVAILVAAYVVAGRFGGQVADMLAPSTPTVPGGEPQVASETTIYLAYVLLFLAVLVVLSLLAILLQKLIAKAGLSFFDRLGGGVLGVATGACVVLFGLCVVNMFFARSQLAMAAESSHSMRLSKQAIDWLGSKVPDDVRKVFALAPLAPALLPGADPLAPLPDANDPNREAPPSPSTVPDRPKK